MNNEYRDIISFDGTLLKCLVRETGNSKWLIVTHGLGEHLGRHEYMLKLFSQVFNIAIYDLRGHGRSGGEAAYVEDFSHYRKDLSAILAYLRREFNLKDYALFGHSLGGLITASFMQHIQEPDEYPSKVFLNAPVVAAPGLLGPVFSNAPTFLLDTLTKAPSVPVPGFLNLKRLSHDTRIFESYMKDEFTHKKIQSKLLYEIVREARNVFSRPLRVDCPLYVTVGTGDTVVNPEALIDYFEKVEKGSQLRVFKGAYHEIHNEVDKWRRPYVVHLRECLTGMSFE